jgi:hypothetical protein
MSDYLARFFFNPKTREQQRRLTNHGRQGDGRDAQNGFHRRRSQYPQLFRLNLGVGSGFRREFSPAVSTLLTPVRQSRFQSLRLRRESRYGRFA